MRKKALQPEERKIMIVNWFAIRIEHGNDNHASSYEIAKGIGLSPSAHIRRIIGSMVVDGQLEMIIEKRSGRWEGSYYRLKKGTFKRPPKQTIKINFGNVNNRQMELL